MCKTCGCGKDKCHCGKAMDTCSKCGGCKTCKTCGC